MKTLVTITKERGLFMILALLSTTCLAQEFPIDEQIAMLGHDFYLTRRSAETLLLVNLTNPKVLEKVKEAADASSNAQIKESCRKILKQFYTVVSSDPQNPIVSIVFLPSDIKYASTGDITPAYLKRAAELFSTTLDLHEMNRRQAHPEEFQNQIDKLAMELWIIDKREAGNSKDDLVKILDLAVLNYEESNYAPPYWEAELTNINVVIDKILKTIKLK